MNTKNKKNKYHPFPVVDQVRKDILLSYGVNVYAKKITNEDREIASRFNVAEELEKAKKAIEKNESKN